ncbi:MAG: MobA/MobL family protein, partial [Hyphomicrobiaceae bacterium]|nr:MobA/MobL family protein [Hyphomicrobiaceae bacterium]
MAIYSLRMSAVGKTTQKQPFTAAAHLKYITRTAAVTSVLAARMPDSRRDAIAWLKREEQADRKNARIIDKVVLALPRELSLVHWQALVTAFAEKLTHGRAAWFAAFHTKGKDAGNPHCHLILRDRDHKTGRRVMFLSAGPKEAGDRRRTGKSAPTTLRAIRELWERCANAALTVAGRPERIDHRSLRAQGQNRAAQVHEGPNIRAMQRRGFRPRSRDRVVRNSPFRRSQGPETRVIRYGAIDKGMTRAEYNDA